MEYTIDINETWNANGKLIERVTVKVFEDGTEEIINTETYEN